MSNKHLCAVLVALAGCATSHRPPPSSKPAAGERPRTERPPTTTSDQPAAAARDVRPGEGSCAEQHDRLVGALKVGVKPEQRAAVVSDLAAMGATLAVLRRSGDTAAECARLTRALVKAAAGDWFKAIRAAPGPVPKRLHLQLSRIYGIYLRHFPRAAESNDFAFYRAELLAKAAERRAAAEAYELVSRRSPLPGGKDYRVKAALGAVAMRAALYNLIGLGVRNAAAKARAKHKPAAKPSLPGTARRLIAAIDRYLVLAPTAPKAAWMRYTKAHAYHSHRYYPQAVQAFGAVLTSHPGHELAASAARLLLDSLNRLGEHEQLARWADRMLAMPQLTRGNLKRDLEQLKLNIGRKRAEQANTARRFAECGRLYIALAKRFRGHRTHPELLYNAGVCFEAGGDRGRALAARARLVKEHPRNTLVDKVIGNVCADARARKRPFWRRRCRGR